VGCLPGLPSRAAGVRSRHFRRHASDGRLSGMPHRNRQSLQLREVPRQGRPAQTGEPSAWFPERPYIRQIEPRQGQLCGLSRTEFPLSWVSLIAAPQGGVMVSPVPLPQHACRLAYLNPSENKQSAHWSADCYNSAGGTAECQSQKSRDRVWRRSRFHSPSFGHVLSANACWCAKLWTNAPNSCANSTRCSAITGPSRFRLQPLAVPAPTASPWAKVASNSNRISPGLFRLAGLYHYRQWRNSLPFSLCFCSPLAAANPPRRSSPRFPRSSFIVPSPFPPPRQ